MYLYFVCFDLLLVILYSLIYIIMYFILSHIPFTQIPGFQWVVPFSQIPRMQRVLKAFEKLFDEFIASSKFLDS